MMKDKSLKQIHQLEKTLGKKATRFRHFNATRGHKLLQYQLDENGNITILFLRGFTLGKFPQVITRIISLKKLHLTHCKVESLPEKISNLHNLREFEMYGSDIEVLPIELIYLPCLESLLLSYFKGPDITYKSFYLNNEIKRHVNLEELIHDYNAKRYGQIQSLFEKYREVAKSVLIKPIKDIEPPGFINNIEPRCLKPRLLKLWYAYENEGISKIGDSVSTGWLWSRGYFYECDGFGHVMTEEGKRFYEKCRDFHIK